MPIDWGSRHLGGSPVRAPNLQQPARKGNNREGNNNMRKQTWKAAVSAAVICVAVAAGARIVVGGTTQLKPGKYPVFTLASAEAAAAVVPNLTLDASTVTRGDSARLVAKGETVYVSIPKGFMVIVK